jgi:hypothetical protein
MWSLDLRIERSAGDHVADEEGGEWLRIDEQLFREFNERARGLALFVEGRIIYEMMETVWPSAAQDESLPDHLRSKRSPNRWSVTCLSTLHSRMAWP